jgi:putative ABC transport system ATP-binding protein
MPNSPILIQAEAVSREYRLGETLIRAVNEVSLTIRGGEFLALLGSSGSGKSTLLRLLAGLDRPTSGAIRVQDRNLSGLDAEELARYRRETVGMVFQSFNLLPRMTLEENVELPLRLAEVDRKERESRVSEALERVGLGPRRQHRPSELSGGEQQRGALACALVTRPTILFANELTGNLDSVNGEPILLLMREFQNSLGMTIIMVTHERPSPRSLPTASRCFPMAGSSAKGSQRESARPDRVGRAQSPRGSAPQFPDDAGRRRWSGFPGGDAFTRCWFADSRFGTAHSIRAI